MKPRKASMMAPIATDRRRRSSVARTTPMLPINVQHEALLAPEDVVIDALDTLLNGLIRSMEENALRKATLAYTACVATSCVMGMLGMMMLSHTKTPVPVDDAAEHMAPTPAPIDIWSKATVPSKRKPLARTNSHRGAVFGGASPTRESQKSTSPKRSPTKAAPSTHVPASPLMQPETTAAEMDVVIAVQFATSYVDVVPITLEELARRETIERILAAEADRAKRIEMDEARARATATLVTDPDELEKQLPRPPDEPIESEVVLVDEKELLVGENSLLVSRRSKKDLLRRLPPPRLEPQVVVPSGDSARGQSPGTSRNTRATSRASVRPKLTLKPKTPLSRLTPLNFSTPADNAKLFIRYEALNGGPVFDEASSPVSRGVVIRHKGFEKRGADWKAGTTSDALSRNESEPTLRSSRKDGKKRPSRTDSVEANSLRVAPATPPVGFNPPVLPQPVHHHDEAKSLTMRIRTPACRSRRSRRVVDVNDRDDAMIFEPQKVVLRQLKLPHIHDRESSSSISFQNRSLSLPLLAGRSGTPPPGR